MPNSTNKAVIKKKTIKYQVHPEPLPRYLLRTVRTLRTEYLSFYIQ